MAGSYVLDTNVVISLLGNDPAVKGRLETSERVGIPAIVIGELYYGACRSGQVQANCEKIKQLTRESSVLDCDAGTALHYGEIKEKLRAKGHPIPENDIWIAATALRYGWTLVTRDSHFREVEGLTTEIW
jgi:tRNA(fMet)-specific endonuclease VapC